MPAGTITLTNNSAGVNGSGTSFTAELSANDFIVAVVGGVTYTLGVKSVDSATGLTLITAYNGPTVSGIAWTALPNAALVGITAQVAADVAKAIRGLNLDKANWQLVYSGAGSITVNLPDGSQFSGPSWKSLATSLAGLGNSATRNVGTTAGTVAPGDDSRITGALQTSGGVMTGQITSTYKGASFYAHPNGFQALTNEGYNYSTDARNGDGTVILQDALYVSNGNYWAKRSILTVGSNAYVWEQRGDGSFRSPGTVYAGGAALTSDRRLKSNFEPVDYDIDIIDKIIPQRYDKRTPEGDAPPPPVANEPVEGEEQENPVASEPIPVTPTTFRELGIVAQDLQAVLPDLVSEYYWNEKYPDLLSINYSGLAAWLVGYVANLKDLVKAQEETISKQDSAIRSMEVRLAELEARMKSIDGLGA